jgi:hypothetical protein
MMERLRNSSLSNSGNSLFFLFLRTLIARLHALPPELLKERLQKVAPITKEFAK